MRNVLWMGLWLCLAASGAARAQDDDDDVAAFLCSTDSEAWVDTAPCPRSVQRESVAQVSGTVGNDNKPYTGTVRLPVSVPVYETALDRESVCLALRRHTPVFSRELGGGGDIYQRNLLRDRFRCVF